ncbi:MAG: hypothetical protein P9E67_03325 [Candidatus Competibacter sp.]|nr:hypothetical protein [Candidatus Competibacter sp.]
MKTLHLAHLTSFLIEPGLEPLLYLTLLTLAGFLMILQLRWLALALIVFVFASILLPVVLEPVLVELFLLLPPEYEWAPSVLFNGLLVCLVIGVLVPRSVRHQVVANLLTLAIVAVLLLPFRVLRTLFRGFRT